MLSNKWNRIRKNISELQLIEDAKEIIREIEEIKILAEKRLKKISSSVVFEDDTNMINSKIPNMFSNTITQFLYEEIFPGTEPAFPSKELYEKYKNWCTYSIYR